jgi:hypothetical protein
MVENQEVLSNEDAWKTEAAGVIQDIQQHVQNICISETIQSTNQCIYLNVTTMEGIHCCVELSASGFKIVGNAYDYKAELPNRHFETPYALLNHISPSFSNSFGNLLLKKLEHIQTQDNDCDPSV